MRRREEKRIGGRRRSGVHRRCRIGPELFAGRRRDCRCSVKKFGGLRRSSQGKRKGGKGGVLGLFIAARFLAEDARVRTG
jgi:hypothetical protein